MESNALLSECECAALKGEVNAQLILNVTLIFDKYLTGNALAMDQDTKRSSHKLLNVRFNDYTRTNDVLHNEDYTPRASPYSGA